MKHGTVIINTIIADDGFWLTNGQGIYSKEEILLGKNDSALNWHEITDEEYQQNLTEGEKRSIQNETR